MNTDEHREKQWQPLVRRAWLLAWATVLYNLVEGVVSIGFGVAEDSVALWGFGADSFIEVGSALIVLWRLRDLACAPTERERRATLGIGALFVLLAFGVAVGSILQLHQRHHPQTTVPGLVIALASLSFMVFLWRAKLGVAKGLNSAALEADAACSLACIQLSGVLLSGSLLFLLSPSLWWVDGIAALALALLIGREGIGMIRAARHPEFKGGCGCH